MAQPRHITQRLAGDGWAADVFPNHIRLWVSPADDPLPQALETLLTPTQQPHWLCEMVGVDHAGWDEYLLWREPLTAA